MIGAGLLAEVGVLAAVGVVDSGIVSVEIEEQEEAEVFPRDEFKESLARVRNSAAGDCDSSGNSGRCARSRPEGRGVVAGGGRSGGVGHTSLWWIAWDFMLSRGVCRW